MHISNLCWAILAAVGFLSFSGSAQTPTQTPSPTTAIPESPPQEKIKVIFDEKEPGVVFIESNGQRLRVDTGKKIVENLDSSNVANTELVEKGTPDADTDDEKIDPYDFETGDEPWDFRLVNLPTPRNVPKGTLNMTFTHRFSQQLHPISTSARGLLGLDSFAIASFGLSYGITDKFFVSAYRSPLCRTGLCRTVELGVGYNWIAQNKKSPIALTTFASVEGNDNFTEEYTYNLQAQLSARLGKRVYLFFAPAIHINSNGQRRFNPRPNDYFPAATIANTFPVPKHGASFGFGASVMITPNVSAMFDFVPRSGFKMGSINPVRGPNFSIVGFQNVSHPSIGFGIQRNLGRHAFALTFSNTQATTTSRYNSSNLTLSPSKLIIGFNLSRRF